MQDVVRGLLPHWCPSDMVKLKTNTRSSQFCPWLGLMMGAGEPAVLANALTIAKDLSSFNDVMSSYRVISHMFIF